MADTVPAERLRVMSLNQCTDQLVLMLLPADRITSVTWLARDPGGSLMAEAAQRVATNRGLAEEVLRDRPDLVIAGSFTTPATRVLLRKLGFPLLELGAAESFDDIRTLTRSIAAATGSSVRAEQLLEEMDSTLAALEAQQAAGGPPIRVAAWDGAGFSARPGSLFEHILRAADLDNVFVGRSGRADGGGDVESLLALRPELLVRGTKAEYDRTGRRADLAYHPLVTRYWDGRTLYLPQAAHVCGTPLAAAAAQRLRQGALGLRAQKVGADVELPP